MADVVSKDGEVIDLADHASDIPFIGVPQDLPVFFVVGEVMRCGPVHLVKILSKKWRNVWSVTPTNIMVSALLEICGQ